MAEGILDEPVRGVTDLDLSLLRLSGADALRTMLDHEVSAAPFARMTGVRMTAVEEGAVSFELPASDWLLGPKGRIPPGFLAFFADAPLSYAVESSLPQGVLFTTAELSLTFFGDHPRNGGTLAARGSLLHNDGQNVLSATSIRDTDGRVVATARLAASSSRRSTSTTCPPSGWSAPRSPTTTPRIPGSGPRSATPCRPRSSAR